MSTLLHVSGLGKRFGGFVALEGIDLDLPQGQRLGLIGPNGSGKSTFVNCVCGTLHNETGTVQFDGHNIDGLSAHERTRNGMARSFQLPRPFASLTLAENLRVPILYAVNARTAGRIAPAAIAARCKDVLALVGLADRAGDRVARFSGGIKRRLNIAAALIHDPDILLFDEPTVGVDPQSRNAIFDNLETLRAAGKALLYTTHYLEEAERLCDRIVVMDQGRAVASDTLAGLLDQLPMAQALTLRLSGAVVDLAALAALPGVSQPRQDGDTLRLGLTDLGRDAPVVLAWLAAQGHGLRQVASDRAGLEDVFMALTGRQLRD